MVKKNKYTEGRAKRLLFIFHLHIWKYAEMRQEKEVLGIYLKNYIYIKIDFVVAKWNVECRQTLQKYPKWVIFESKIR